MAGSFFLFFSIFPILIYSARAKRVSYFISRFSYNISLNVVTCRIVTHTPHILNPPPPPVPKIENYKPRPATALLSLILLFLPLNLSLLYFIRDRRARQSYLLDSLILDRLMCFVTLRISGGSPHLVVHLAAMLI
jgi:hypothetical protein